MPATANILVPLDGSKLAEGAIDVAVDIARPAGGKLTLFIAAELDAMPALADYADSEEITRAMAANAYLAQLAGRVHADGVETEQESSDGTNVAEEILGRADAVGATMIVMTSHGRSGIGRWLLGSITEKVARSANVPVVIVPCESRR